ncbi:MAG TPA: hypothetical protein VFE77_07250 [Rhodanobacter sp.]|nr:hypothetical protein [Rhodanobacter sp.]
MKLLRKSLLLRPLRQLLAGRRAAARRAYAVTVPAPLAAPVGNNVTELQQRTPPVDSRPADPRAVDSRAVLPTQADATSRVHLALASSR